MPAETAASLSSLLAGSPSERSAAYNALEATHDASLGASCVEALLVIAGRRAIDAAEYCRCNLVLAHLAQLDITLINGEYWKDARYLSATAKGNRHEVAMAKQPEEMSREDVRTAAAFWSAQASFNSPGFDAMLQPAGADMAGYSRGLRSQGGAYTALKRTTRGPCGC